jgi:hypothetical protein
MTIYAVEEGNQIGKLLRLLGSSSFPGLTNAIKISANMIQKEWIDTIQKSTAKKGWKSEYIRAIHINFENELNAEVYADENNKYVNFIEDGIKRFDMKPGLINGPKSRQGKNGRYNIVFFRKGVPGTQHIQSMAQTTYTKVKKMSKDDVIRRYKTVGIGEKIQLKTKTVKKRVKTKTSKGPGGLQKIGSRGHSQYGTFRVVSQQSSGWIYPGVPAIKIFSLVSRKVKPTVKKIMQDGLILDIKSGLEYLKG